MTASKVQISKIFHTCPDFLNRRCESVTAFSRHSSVTLGTRVDLGILKTGETLRVPADRLRERERVALEEARQAVVDVPRRRGASVDESRVDLEEARAGADAPVGV